MNVFLRDVLYNRILCERFLLLRLEPWLEVPLDSIVAKGLRKEAGRGVLPTWQGMKKLTRRDSDEYQLFAKSYANRIGVVRVHLDLFLWGASQFER